MATNRIDSHSSEYVVHGLVVRPPSPVTESENLNSYGSPHSSDHVHAECRFNSWAPYHAPTRSAAVDPALLEKNNIENTFAEMVMEPETPTIGSPPLVVLDCANIGWNYGEDMFNPLGVTIALRYFQHLQLDVRAFIPAGYLKAKPRDSSRGNALMETEALDHLQHIAGSDMLTIVPSGDSDDAYILNYALEHNGFVVSNDFFHDHLRDIKVKSIRKSMELWLRDRRCGYTFTRPLGEFLFNPCSQLSLSISTYRINCQAHLPAASTVHLDELAAGLDEAPPRHEEALVAMNALIAEMQRTGQGAELRHLLHARARTLQKVNMKSAAVSDYNFILQFLDTQDAEAELQLKQLTQPAEQHMDH